MIGAPRKAGLIGELRGEQDRKSSSKSKGGSNYANPKGHNYAEALLMRSGSIVPSRARDLLQEALIITRELGMPPLEERVLSLQQRASLLAKPLVSPGGNCALHYGAGGHGA